MRVFKTHGWMSFIFVALLTGGLVFGPAPPPAAADCANYANDMTQTATAPAITTGLDQASLTDAREPLVSQTNFVKSIIDTPKPTGALYTVTQGRAAKPIPDTRDMARVSDNYLATVGAGVGTENQAKTAPLRQ